MRQRYLNTISFGLITMGLLCSCATNPDGSLAIDNRVIGAVGGAVVGCGLAKVAKKDCATGAVVGATVGLMIGWYFESKKIADAKQVNKEYEKKMIIPKNEIKPVAFNSEVNSNVNTSGEKEIQVTSNTDLIGYGDNVPQIEQKYAIYDENNKLIETKTEKVTAVNGAGRYQSKSKFKTTDTKVGKIETTLIANGKEVKKNTYKVS